MSETSRERLTPVDDAAGYPIYRDGDRGTYHTQCVDSDYEPASTAVLAALMSIHDVGIEELESLSDSVDPDALNALVTHWTRDGAGDCGGSLSFPFAGCLVTVRADGAVVIDPDRAVDGS